MPRFKTRHSLLCIIDEIADSLQNFCQDASQDDDISLAEIPCESEILSDWETHSQAQSRHSTRRMETEIYSGEEMEFTLKLAGAFTKNRSHSNDNQPDTGDGSTYGISSKHLYTILTELCINFPDHGVLGLNSSLKQSGGFRPIFR